jgi:uncharacterized protein (TIGR03790 family)
MFKVPFLFACLLFSVASIVATASAADSPLGQLTIVVYNQTQPDSLALAKFYAQQRGIPRDHLVALDCPSNEEISRDDFEATIAGPLREAFRERKWWVFREDSEGKEKIATSLIRFVALMRGVPLKIQQTAQPYPGDEPGAGPIASRNEASVDSELSVLAFDHHRISGAITNPYYQSYRAIREFENPMMLLVCRLDAPTPEIVRRMITDAIATEKTGLWGRAYVDATHGTAPGSELGDKWMRDIAGELRKAGVPVVFEDTPATFPDGFPANDCALYYGWYAGNVSGPFGPPDFHFLPGAVGVHIHSFSATTLRDVNAGWVGPMLARGAAASVGNVYEPYLQLTSHLDILNDRLLHGFTFAESAYMSVQTLSWMSTMVGDPLYRPYSSWLQIDAPRETSRAGQEWKTYHEFAVKNASRPAAEYRTLARQTAARARNGAMLEDLALMEVADGNLAGANGYFQQARASYTKRDDILRVVIQQCAVLIKDNKTRRALDLIRSVLRVVPDAPASALLRKMEQDAKASPTPTPSVH